MINISPTSQITKIYLITNCYGDPNKVYIGKTITNNRKSDHKKTYGKDIIFTYIDEINSLDRKNWKPLEIFWIEYFRQLGFDLQNKNPGGGGPSFQNQETKNKIGIKQKGNPKFILRKKIIQYDINGILIRKWESLTDIKNELNIDVSGISCCAKKKYNQFCGYIWRYENDPIINYNKPLRKRKKIYQFDLKGKLIQEWNDIKELSKNYNIINIGSVCRGYSKTTYGFIWSYSKILNKDRLNLKSNAGKTIFQYDLEGNFIKKWFNSIEASKELKINVGSIYSCLKNRTNTAGKYIFKYN
jgi:hypothetical protein